MRIFIVRRNRFTLMIELDDIYNLIKPKVGRKALRPDIDIFDELGIVGDDFHELIEDYYKRFNVDMSNYLWYFHTDEEGSLHSIGSWIIKPPNRRVKRIPITPSILLEFANKGTWNIEYPSHKLPKYRYDMFINYGILLLCLFFLIKSCIN